MSEHYWPNTRWVCLTIAFLETVRLLDATLLFLALYHPLFVLPSYPRTSQFISTKKVLHLVNMTSRDYLRQSTLPSPTITSIQTAIELQSGESLRDVEVIPVSLIFEEEIRRIRYEEGLQALGEYFQANPTHRSCVELILTLTHRMLGLIHFYTASEKEVKSWCLKQGKTILESSAVVDVNITRYGFDLGVVLCCVGMYSVSCRTSGFFCVKSGADLMSAYAYCIGC